ncbi:hypothetical protein RLL03_00370, partial [Streptococcus pneumoniae]|nr:hypothetical protein [Streptococcus pneumoniae]
RQPKPSRAGSFFSGMFGVMVGALLMWLLFSQAPGLLPGTDTTDSGTQIQQQSREQQGASLDITTDVTKAVDEASDAVVGVSNLQTGGDFFSQSQEQAVGTGSGVIYK